MNETLRKTLTTLTLPTLLASALPATAADVVTSIKPLQLITAALTEGVTEPVQLLPDDGTPHHYALKPSDMRRLTEADVVIWVGPGLEQFLQKPLSRTDAEIVTLLPDSEPHEHGEHAAVVEKEEHHDEHEHEHEHDEHDERDAEDTAAHDHGAGGDPHIWLDPLHTLELAEQILPVLQKQFPQHQNQLLSNYEAFAASVRNKEAEIAAQLAPFSERGFFVFHDAYGGFVEHFGLKQLGYFTVDPARKPGARHLAEIRERLEASEAVCVFSEPQFTSAVVDAIVGDLPVRQGELDPMARGIEPGKDGYIHYLQTLADAFQRCLEKKDQEI